jgi:hypothetical protein
MPVSNLVTLNQSGVGNNNNVGSIFQGAFAPAPVNNGYSLPASVGLGDLQYRLGAGLDQNYALQGQASGLDSTITNLIAQLQGGNYNYGATNCFPTAQPTNCGPTNCYPSPASTGSYPMMDPSTFFQGGLAGLFGQQGGVNGGGYAPALPSYGGGGHCRPHHKRHHGGGFVEGKEFHASWGSVNGSSWFAKLPSQHYQSGGGYPAMPQLPGYGYGSAPQVPQLPYNLGGPMLYTAQV